MSQTLLGSLTGDGYCVARERLDSATMERLQKLSSSVVARISASHRARNRSQGSLINLSDHPQYAEIIGHPALLDLFADLAFPAPRFSSGYLISKPPASPALFWHQDWWGWDHPLSYSALIAQVFIMIYLCPTTSANGCLRVLPGSHRRRHALHTATAAHGQALSAVANPDDPLYQEIAEQVAVPVQPGDVVVGDARLLHGAYPNRSEQERSLLTLWYHPDVAALPEAMQARIQAIYLRRDVDTDPEGQTLIRDWPAPQRARIETLLPDYRGDAPAHAWNRQPDPARLE